MKDILSIILGVISMLVVAFGIILVFVGLVGLIIYDGKNYMKVENAKTVEELKVACTSDYYGRMSIKSLPAKCVPFYLTK